MRARPVLSFASTACSQSKSVAADLVVALTIPVISSSELPPLAISVRLVARIGREVPIMSGVAWFMVVVVDKRPNTTDYR